MFKPRMNLDFKTKMGDSRDLIDRAATILYRFGLRREAQNIQQEATISGYEFHTCLVLLKRYMTV